MPPFERWPTFLEGWEWNQGEHLTLTGPTGSGKTTLAREILRRRDYTLVLGTKRRDSSLYRPLMAEGFVIQDELDLSDPNETPKIIFRPPLSTPDRAGLASQADAFASALYDVFREGGWCVYSDEVRYLTQTLNLKSVFQVLWLQGRSLGITMVVATQRPVWIPLEAYSQAFHQFAWRQTVGDDIDRISEFSGTVAPTVKYALPRLPLHEVLYIGTVTERVVRTNIRS